ncbi:MAG TPA: alkaline phosphatase family protein [Bacillota bacterium]|nr:alkaline phosphatase family protein [Bacillota bacterium]
MIFLDGVGLGAPVADNPFVFTETPHLKALLEGRPLCFNAAGFHGARASLIGLDAVMGIKGLPQSATGQASLFSGVNAPRYLGSHLNGYPNEKLRRLLEEKGIFKQLALKNYRCTFANAYRPPFFQLLQQGLPGCCYSCTTLVTYYGGLTFRSLDHLRQGQAIYMDIDHSLLRELEKGVEPVTPAEAGRRLVELSQNYDFTLFEYFLSDLVGHSTDHEEARRVVKTLDCFIGSVAERLNPAETLLIVTSDHGNLEDLGHREHTINPVPALLVGDHHLRRAIAARMTDLTHVLPAIETALLWPDRS